jgi:hypothetical protein
MKTRSKHTTQHLQLSAATSITEKEVIKAVDAQNQWSQHSVQKITNSVWVGREGYSMCYGSNFDTAHGTDYKEAGA